jgi:hypothetical protein
LHAKTDGGAEEEEEIDEDDDGMETDGNQSLDATLAEPVFIEADVNTPDAWEKLKRAAVGHDDLRKVVIFSPLWGMIDSKNREGGEDHALNKANCALFCKNLSEFLGQESIVAIHLPPFPNKEMIKWYDCMLDSGFVAYTSPFFLVGDADKLTSYTKWQTKRNFHSIVIFHKADVKPQVSAAFVRETSRTGEPTKAQNVLSVQLWNAAMHSKTIMKVPDGERVRAGTKGKEAKRPSACSNYHLEYPSLSFSGGGERWTHSNQCSLSICSWGAAAPHWLRISCNVPSSVWIAMKHVWRLPTRCPIG